MLSFNTGLTNALSKDSTESIFLVRLYYGDESSYTGLSSKDYMDGSDSYHGLILSLSPISSSLNLFGFDSKNQAITLRLSNTKSFQGGRISEEFGTNQYDNRKYEIYVTSPGETKEIISYGSIAGNYKFTGDSITLSLNDLRDGKDLHIPQSRITKALYPKAPESNLNKVIPITYGDHGVGSSYHYNTLSSNGVHGWGSRSKVPALITNEFDTATDKLIAKPDTVAMNEMDNKAIYTYKDGIYSQFSQSNTGSNDTNATVSVGGKTANALFGVVPQASETEDLITDKYRYTFIQKSFTGAGEVQRINFAVPKVQRLGDISINGIEIYSVIDLTGATMYAQIVEPTSPFTAISSQVTLSANQRGRQIYTVYGDYTSDEQSSWDLEKHFALELDTSGLTGSRTVKVEEIFVEVTYTVEHMETDISLGGFSGGYAQDESDQETMYTRFYV